MNKNTQELLSAGSDILRSVTAAVDRNDYTHLASDISQVVRSVNITKTPNLKGRSAEIIDVTYRNPARTEVKPQYFLQKKVRKSQGIPQMVVSGTFGIFMGLMSLVGLITGATVGAIFSGVTFLVCGGLFYKGYLKNTLTEKYYRYGAILGSAEYFSISELAGAVFKTDKEVLKDIKALIKGEYLPRAHLDSTETTCMITDDAYRLYLDSVKAHNQRLLEEKSAAQEAEKNTKEADGALPPQVRSILREGNEYIAFVRRVNDVIPDTEEMSNKLYRLEDIMNRIFAQVKKEPESADELHRLMEYYLPTTKKLLNAYMELDKQPAVGDNITRTKQEIDSAMDTINEAFENLLNSLFQDMAWDISSDISVMKTMLRQDGLTEDTLHRQGKA